MKKIILSLSLISLLFLTSGCFKRDDLEDVDIYTTAYPIEFIADELYGYNSNVQSIYPDGADINNYELTSKHTKEYSKGAIFIYNGLSNEKEIARTFINKNKKLKLIDVAYGLSLNDGQEELWLSPQNYLMLTQTVKNNLQEFITNKYIKEEIENNYNKLEIKISEMDAELRTIAKNASSNTIITTENSLKILNKYGFDVTSISDEEYMTQTNEALIKKKFQDGKIKYLFVAKGKELSELAVQLKDKYDAKIVEINMLDILTDDQRKNNDNYYTLMQANIETIKNALYEK